MLCLHVMTKTIAVTTAGDPKTNVVSLCVCLGDEDGEAEEGEELTMKLEPSLAKAERSHLIVWQILANED